MEIAKKNIGNFIFILCSGLIICFGTLISYGSLGLDYYVKNEFILSIFILILIAIRDRVSLFIISKKNAWCILMLFALLSEIINGRIHVINLLSLTFFVLAAVRLTEHSYKVLISAVIIAQFIFFYLYRLESYFNSYALTTAMIGIEIMLLFYISKKSKLWQLVCVFLLFFVILFAMASRTSLLAFSIGGIILVLGSIKNMKTNRLIALCGVVVFGGFFLWKYYDVIYNLFFNKWTNLGYSSDDVSSGRFAMWKDVIFNQRTLLGHTENFINDKYSHQDLHNIFVQVLGKYGTLCFISFCAWFVDFIKRIAKLSSTYRLIFLSFFSFYFVAGMTENVLFLDCKVFMIVFCFSINLAWLYKVSDQEKYERTLLQEVEE